MKKFTLGQLLTTRGVHECMERDERFGQFVTDCLIKYANCDWGSTYAEDAKLNDEAVANGEDRVLAVYIPDWNPKQRIWIITEADRSATTVLFPSEY